MRVASTSSRSPRTLSTGKGARRTSKRSSSACKLGKPWTIALRCNVISVLFSVTTEATPSEVLLVTSNVSWGSLWLDTHTWMQQNLIGNARPRECVRGADSDAAFRRKWDGELELLCPRSSACQVPLRLGSPVRTGSVCSERHRRVSWKCGSAIDRLDVIVHYSLFVAEHDEPNDPGSILWSDDCSLQNDSRQSVCWNH